MGNEEGLESGENFSAEAPPLKINNLQNEPGRIAHPEKKHPHPSGADRREEAGLQRESKSLHSSTVDQPDSGKREGHPPDQKKHNTNRIVIEYRGTLSARMDFDDLALSQIEQVSDLGSQVIIGNGKELPKATVVQVGGDILAFRRILRIGEKIPRDSKVEEVKVCPDFQNRQIKVEIEDRLISERVRREKGDFNTNFTTEFNRALRSGLIRALTAEKMNQLKASTGFDLISIGGPSVMIGLGAVSFRLIANGTLSNYGFFLPLATGIFGTTLTIRGMSAALYSIGEAAKHLREGYPISSVRDFIPFKHLINLARGISATLGGGELVKLN